jgi:hypothetical protein
MRFRSALCDLCVLARVIQSKMIGESLAKIVRNAKSGFALQVGIRTCMKRGVPSRDSRLRPAQTGSVEES